MNNMRLSTAGVVGVLGTTLFLTIMIGLGVKIDPDHLLTSTVVLFIAGYLAYSVNEHQAAVSYVCAGGAVVLLLVAQLVNIELAWWHMSLALVFEYLLFLRLDRKIPAVTK